MTDIEKERKHVEHPSKKTLRGVTSIYCDSGLSMGEAIFCNIHTGKIGNQYWGVNKVIINDINYVTLVANRNKLLPVGMMVNREFSKPTTCTYKNKTIQCDISEEQLPRHELIEF